MLRKIDSNEASTKLREIILRVEAGEASTITRNGKPIAVILKAKKPNTDNTVLIELKETGRK